MRAHLVAGSLFLQLLYSVRTRCTVSREASAAPQCLGWNPPASTDERRASRLEHGSFAIFRGDCTFLSRRFHTQGDGVYFLFDQRES